jgi:hypothetical protein
MGGKWKDKSGGKGGRGMEGWEGNGRMGGEWRDGQEIFVLNKATFYLGIHNTYPYIYIIIYISLFGGYMYNINEIHKQTNVLLNYSWIIGKLNTVNKNRVYLIDVSDVSFRQSKKEFIIVLTSKCNIFNVEYKIVTL